MSRDYTNAFNSAVQQARTTALYPDSPGLLGLKAIGGEQAVFNYVIEDCLKHHRVPNRLIRFLTARPRSVTQ